MAGRSASARFHFSSVSLCSTARLKYQTLESWNEGETLAIGISSQSVQGTSVLLLPVVMHLHLSMIISSFVNVLL